MNFSVDWCVLCLSLANNENRTSILSQGSEGIVIEEKCRFVLNEHINIKPEVPYHMCLTCSKNLDYVYNFKQTCLKNIKKFNNYVDTLRTNKHLKLTVTDIKYDKEIEPTCDNESGNEITPSFEVVLVEEYIADDSVINNTLEEEKAVHQNEQFSGQEKSGTTNMQYSSSLSEKGILENFLMKVKNETEFKLTHEEVFIKHEELFEATYSDNLNDELQKEEVNTTENISTSSSYSDRNKPLNNPEVTEFDTNPTESLFKCDVCNKMFTRLAHLKTHKHIHTGERPYTCNYCNQAFIQLSNLQTHKRVHTGEKPFKCDVCEKAFAFRTDLYLHKRVHPEKKPFACDGCDKRFFSGKHLMAHKRMHTGERPYKCDACKKTFTHSISLAVHKCVHTGEPPYKCDVCNRVVYSGNDLIVHKRIHSGKKPYECDVCKKGFNAEGTLKRHALIHTGESPYGCDVCPKKFRDLYNLNRHKRGHTL